MRRFYCDIWGQKINANQCYFRKDPLGYGSNSCCQNCPTLRVSPAQLKAFAQEKFQSMLKFEGELKKDRKTIRRMWKKEESSERMQSRRTGKIREKKNEPTGIRESVIKGKEKTYTNVFVFELNYLLNREIEKRNREVMTGLKINDEVDVYNWISRFFAENRYKKHNKKGYTGSDIRRIVESLEKKEDFLRDKFPEYPMRERYQELCNHELKEFCERT